MTLAKLCWTFLLGVIFVATAAHAQAPRTIRYDGRLEQNGRPADGGYDLGFALFDAAQAGNQLWPAAAGTFATVRVTVSNGQFVVELGGQGMEALAWQVFAASRVFVQTQVNGTALNGRRAIGAVPFAVKSENGIPPGFIAPFAGASVPAGWIPCDGRAVDSRIHGALFAAIGSQFGNGGDGDGPLFNVPDLRGRFIRGDGGGADPDGARALGSVQSWATALPRAGFTITPAGSHTHDFVGGCPGGHTDGPADASKFKISVNSPRNCWDWRLSTAPDHQHSVIGGDAETRPTNVALAYLIKE